MADQSQNQQRQEWRCSLWRLVMAVSLFAALLGVGRWWWLAYQRAFVVVPLTEKDDLSLHVGRRVTFTCFNDRNHGVLYLGSQVIVCGFPLYSGRAFDKAAAQPETIEGVLVVYDGYAREIAERQPAKYALENSDNRGRFLVTNAAVAFLLVDPLLVWLLRRLRKHRAWYLGLWIPITAFLSFGVGYGVFLLKTHNFRTEGYGFITYQPGAWAVAAASFCLAYLSIALMCALPYWEWKRPKGELVFCLTTAICIAASVLLRAWCLADH